MRAGELPAVKYLSSSKLMRLQLQDAGFRRQFLTQALIFLHCCANPGRNEKGATLRAKQVDTIMYPSLCSAGHRLGFWFRSSANLGCTQAAEYAKSAKSRWNYSPKLWSSMGIKLRLWAHIAQ